MSDAASSSSSSSFPFDDVSNSSPASSRPSSTMSPLPSASSVSPAPLPSKPEVGPIICPGHSRPVPDISFTPHTADGFFLISACLDNKAMLRDGQSGDWIGTFIGHKGAVWSARLNREATKAATGAADFSAKLWDALTGDELQSFTHRHIVKSVTFSMDGSLLFTGGHEKKLRVWDLAKPDQAALHTGEGHTATITHCMAVSDQHLVLTAAQEKDVRVWDIRQAAQTVQTIDTQGAQVKGAQVTIDGSTLAVCTADKQVLFYDATQPGFPLVKQHALPLVADCVAYSRETGVFVTGSDSELWARVWRFESGDEMAVNKGHHGPVRAVAFAPDGGTFASGSEDGTIRIWQLAK